MKSRLSVIYDGREYHGKWTETNKEEHDYWLDNLMELVPRYKCFTLELEDGGSLILPQGSIQNAALRVYVK